MDQRPLWLCGYQWPQFPWRIAAAPDAPNQNISCCMGQVLADRRSASMVRACGGLSGRDGVARGGPAGRNAAKRPEYADFRILDEVNDAREEVVAGLALTDVDNCRVHEHTLEDG